MAKWVRNTLLGVGVFLLLFGVGLVAIYYASQQEPEFYRRAVQADSIHQRQASDQMLQRTTALAGDVRHEGHWEALFTTEQINGWLAVDLARNHPDALPEGFSDPRVAITPKGLDLACRVRHLGVASVVSLSVDIYLAKPDVMALRIHKVRAGLLPMPRGGLIKGITEGARRLDLTLEWRQAGGDPVALVTVPPPRDAKDRIVHISALQLGDGEIYVAGTTEKVTRQRSTSSGKRRSTARP